VRDGAAGSAHIACRRDDPPNPSWCGEVKLLGGPS
jgi:hypothetical protein